MPTILDNDTADAVRDNLDFAHAQVREIANSLFGARTMTKAERHALGRRLNAANVRVRTALIRLGGASA